MGRFAYSLLIICLLTSLWWQSSNVGLFDNMLNNIFTYSQTHTIFIVEQWGLFDRQFGRADTQDPDPEGRVPIWEKASVQEMKDKFVAVGFGPRQVLHIFHRCFC